MKTEEQQITEDQLIQEFLSRPGTIAEKKAELRDMFNDKITQKAYTYHESYKPDDNCKSGMAVRGMITVDNDPDPIYNKTYYGLWICQ